MQNLSVALAQIAPKLGDVASNVELHLEQIERAVAGGAGLVVFPELSLTGYLLRDQVPDVACRSEADALKALARASERADLIVGFIEETADHRFYNAAGYFAGGRLIHVHRKLYLPTYGLFDEGRDVGAGDALRAFDTGFGRAGMMICEDAWHPTTAWLLAQQGAEILFVLGNGPTRGAREGRGITSLNVWRDLLRVTAQFQTSWVVYVNRAGVEDGLSFGGGSAVVDPFGRVTAESPALDPDLSVVPLEDEVLRRARTAYPLLRDGNLELVHRELKRLRNVRFELEEEEVEP